MRPKLQSLKLAKTNILDIQPDQPFMQRVQVDQVDIGCNLFVLLFPTDVRVGYCFGKFDEDGCTSPKARQMTKSVCCCTMGAGWGDPCELCPRQNTCKQLRLQKCILKAFISMGRPNFHSYNQTL